MVSIIIPTYNRSHVIENALQSILKQTYSNWECVIVDDGSIDNTLPVLKKYTEKDARFKVLSRSSDITKGASSCRNIGLFFSKGDYIIFLDSDDYLMETCLENRVLEFERNRDKDFLVFPMAIKKKGEIIDYKIPESESYLNDFLNYKLHWQTMCPIWKKEFIQNLKGFKASYPRLNDPELMIRALLVPNVKFKVFTKANYDTVYNMNVINWVALKDKYYQSLILFIPEVSQSLEEVNKTDLKKYLSRYLKVWFRDFMFPSQLNLVKQNNTLINLFYKHQIISIFKKFKLKGLLFVHNVFYYLKRKLKDLIINLT
ncbi:glycosyltransferase family 2 protein [Algibacter pacificus]|uniref:glycosyltransferase family 2 protein n=1 Tax=Algibacter pacificus TaxID=2599389 RepID=UPI0011CC9FF5|nr:glycosyltransferase family 2 protein [Algibacter pacificus]